MNEVGSLQVGCVSSWTWALHGWDKARTGWEWDRVTAFGFPDLRWTFDDNFLSVDIMMTVRLSAFSPPTFSLCFSITALCTHGQHHT